MNKNDLDKLVRWAVDSDLERFAEDSYGVTGTAYEIAKEGDYLRGKFRQMQSNFIMWLSGLSNRNRIRLSRNITFREAKEKEEKLEMGTTHEEYMTYCMETEKRRIRKEEG